MPSCDCSLFLAPGLTHQGCVTKNKKDFLNTFSFYCGIEIQNRYNGWESVYGLWARSDCAECIHKIKCKQKSILRMMRFLGLGWFLPVPSNLKFVSLIGLCLCYHDSRQSILELVPVGHPLRIVQLPFKHLCCRAPAWAVVRLLVSPAAPWSPQARSASLKSASAVSEHILQ